MHVRARHEHWARLERNHDGDSHLRQNRQWYWRDGRLAMLGKPLHDTMHNDAHLRRIFEPRCLRS